MLQLTIYQGPPNSGKTAKAQQAIKAAEHCHPIFIASISSIDAFVLLADLLQERQPNTLRLYPFLLQQDYTIDELHDLHFFTTTTLPLQSFAELFKEIPNVQIIQCYQSPKPAIV